MGCFIQKNRKVTPEPAIKEVQTINFEMNMIETEQFKIKCQLQVISTKIENEDDKELQIKALKQQLDELELKYKIKSDKLDQALKVINNFQGNLQKIQNSSASATKYQYTISEVELKKLENEILELNKEDYGNQMSKQYHFLSNNKLNQRTQAQNNNFQDQNQNKDSQNEIQISNLGNQNTTQGKKNFQKISIYFDGNFNKYESNQINVDGFYQHDCKNKQRRIYLTEEGEFYCQGGCQKFEIKQAYINFYEKTISTTRIEGNRNADKINSSKKLKAIVKQSLQLENQGQNFLTTLFKSQGVIKLENET